MKNKRKIIIACIIILVILLLVFFTVMLWRKEKTNRAFIDLLSENKYEFVEIRKAKQAYTKESTQNYTKLTEKDISKIKSGLYLLGLKKYNTYEIGTVFIESGDLMLYQENLLKYFNNIVNTTDFLIYDTPYVRWSNGFAFVEWNESEFAIENIIGRMPLAKDEIVISNYIADILMRIGINVADSGENFYPKSYDEIINYDRFIRFGEYYKVKIVGIIDYDISDYENIKNLTWEQYNRNYEVYSNILEKLSNKCSDIYNRVFVTSEFINTLSEKMKDSSNNDIWKLQMVHTGFLTYNKNYNYEKLVNKFYSKGSKITVYTSFNELFEDE